MGESEDILPMIKLAVREVLAEDILPRLNNLEKQILELANIKATLNSQQTCLNEHTKSLTFLDQEVKEIQSKSIPRLETKFTDLNEKMCLNLLNLDVHRRKWTLLINGIKGESGENELVTRDKVKCFAKDKLEIEGADSHPLASCHRLAQRNDAGIIIRFVDLNDRNNWLSSARKLKNKRTSVSISPDLPPVLRPLKDDILQIRKDLPPEDKKHSQVKYLPTWPYACLSVRGKPNINPRITKSNIIANYLT